MPRRPALWTITASLLLWTNGLLRFCSSSGVDAARHLLENDGSPRGDTCNGSQYKVQEGDYAFLISTMCGITVRELGDLNPWLAGRDVLCVPEDCSPGWKLPLLGTGVHVYVLDTGILSSHQQFEQLDESGLATGKSRVDPVEGYTAFDDDISLEDCNGSGTHVAAIIGGRDTGIAKNVTLHSVRVLDCNGPGTTSSVLEGLSWVAENAMYPAVVCMSIGTFRNEDLNEAVENLINVFGIPVIVPAGNEARNACDFSPASTPSAITVAAMDEDQLPYVYSNWGPCVDIHAPGTNIVSAVVSSSNATAPKTGTSMAAALVCGFVAVYISEHPGASVDEVTQKLLQSAKQVESLKYLWNPEMGRQQLKNSTDLLLYSALVPQMYISPSILTVKSSQQKFQIKLRLAHKPTSQVVVNIDVPKALDGAPLMTLSSDSWEFAPPASLNASLNHSAPSSVPQPGSPSTPSPKDFGRYSEIEGDHWSVAGIEASPTIISVGGYFLRLHLRSKDPFFDGALHTIRVFDQRPVTGSTLTSPRVIDNLPPPFSPPRELPMWVRNLACPLYLLAENLH